jgi:hypothetical protein
VRRLLISASLSVVLVAAGACHNGGTTPAVPTSVPVPTSVTGKPFGPPDLGVTLMTPATWQTSGAASGFEYSLRDTGPTHAYLLATSATAPAGATPGRFAQRRADYLRTLGGTIESTGTTTVDGHGAARLRYRLATPRGAVEDVEYDIARGPRFVIIALGEPAPATDTSLFDWIMSTVRVTT